MTEIKVKELKEKLYNTKVRVHSIEISEKVQKALFKLGIKWLDTGETIHNYSVEWFSIDETGMIVKGGFDTTRKEVTPAEIYSLADQMDEPKPKYQPVREIKFKVGDRVRLLGTKDPAWSTWEQFKKKNPGLDKGSICKIFQNYGDGEIVLDITNHPIFTLQDVELVEDDPVVFKDGEILTPETLSKMRDYIGEQVCTILNVPKALLGIQTEENKMELKEIKPVNLKIAKAQVIEENMNEEIRQAKIIYRTHVDTNDRLDRNIKALQEEKKEHTEAIAMFKSK